LFQKEQQSTNTAAIQNNILEKDRAIDITTVSIKINSF
jgi:hypothetical protein